jgi:hypothetical protein
MTDGQGTGAKTDKGDAVAAGRRRTFIVLVVAVTILLLAMLLRSSYIMLNSDMYDLPAADREDRKNALEYMNLMEDVLVAVGLTVLVIGLLYGALMDPAPSDLVRLGLLLAVAIILGLFIGGALW